MPNEIAGHEFWGPDGRRIWFDLQIPMGKTFYLAGADIASGETIHYPLDRDQWSVHYNISHDGRFFAGDGGGPEMVGLAKAGQSGIWLFVPVNGKLRAEQLCSLAKHNYALEPNVSITPDGQWVVFNSNMFGSPQVYAVEIARGTKGGRH